MKIPFLQKIISLATPPTGQVVGSGPAAAAVHTLLAELPELLLAAVLDTSSGNILAAYASTREYQPATIAAATTAAVGQLQANLAAQGLAPAELGEVVLTLTTQLHLLRLVPGTRQLLYLAVDARDTNLAIMRQLVEQAAEQLGLPASPEADLVD